MPDEACSSPPGQGQFWPRAEPRVLSVRAGVQSEVDEWRGRPALIKTLLTDDPQARFRFFQEGQIASGLQHPLIVPLLEQTPDRLVFAFVAGPTLRERVEAGPLPLPEALSVTCGLLTALSYLHACGVTHQDLKPENVLLAGGRGVAGAVRLVDFGMSHARALAPDPESNPEGSARMGTPHFMAPEQFRGVRGDPRSDLYSAGVLLFDCLTGHPPYEDALGWLSGLTAKCAPLPGPPRVQALLKRALSRDPADRPQSAVQMNTLLREAAWSLGLESVCPEDLSPEARCP